MKGGKEDDPCARLHAQEQWAKNFDVVNLIVGGRTGEAQLGWLGPQTKKEQKDDQAPFDPLARRWGRRKPVVFPLETLPHSEYSNTQSVAAGFFIL